MSSGRLVQRRQGCGNDSHHEREMKTRPQGHRTIDPPQHPRQRCHTLAPSRHTHQHRHIDDGRKPDGKRRDEQALMWMPEDSSEELWVHGIS